MSEERDLLRPLLRQVERGEIETRYQEKAIDHESKLRLGPSPHLSHQEVAPKNKNFREKLERKGRPDPQDVLLANLDSEHLPHVQMLKNGIISIGTGKKSGLGISIDPVKREITLTGYRLNLNFNEIDLRALNLQLLVQHLVQLIVSDGDLRAKVAGQAVVQANTLNVIVSKWTRMESQDIVVSTNTPQLSTKDVGEAAKALIGGSISKGSITVLTDNLTMSASQQYLVNSPNIRHGHNGAVNPYGLGPFPPLRPAARKYDKTEHFCPYIGSLVGGWISSGSENHRST